MYTYDNRYVAPYSPILCKIFDAHITVEFCYSVKAIKYIFKYIYKGSDQAVFEISNNSNNAAVENDEINQYQVGWYINSNEAVSTILGFSIHDR
ncbi:hypothetical protein AaE_001905 [Aphanomyces astaci]|uniref:Uncharacterized protein n=1 Tax=Aphanomyces astaci TaxID=112090 RepID=A0A6A5AVG5_APHAT|nr:hypothetical protein AaE_001905 [Aphanomyces astaci]